jgi:hypothetical protein
MERRFSLGTLLAIVAVAAVGLASIRGALTRVWTMPSNEALMMLPFGLLVGGAFGLALALWNGGGWLRAIVGTLAGFGLGAAAGAQTLAKVEWQVVFLAPIVVVGLAALVAGNRRRRALHARRATAKVDHPARASV